MVARLHKPAPVVITGMYGIGDNLHQRAVLRELMKAGSVTLEGFYPSIVRDLVAAGMQFVTLAGRLPPRIKDGEAEASATEKMPRHAARTRLTYSPAAIHAHGSILAAQFASVGLKMPERPDFSLPVPNAWRERLRSRGLALGKPLLVYRPVVLNKVWEAPSRSPDVRAYAELFAAIRERFFVVSVADLNQQEWIVSEPVQADLTLHNGELSFEELAALFAEADLVFCNPGFTPVLAQAVGTPSIIVYGGNESFRTTNSVGAHLAPTLAVEPDRPCECHDRNHDCDKRITLAPALERVREFAERFACAS